MNNLLKKSFLVSMIVLTALWGVVGVIAPAQAATAKAGDLIKSTSSAAVYYLGADGKKHSFIDEKVFKTWFKDFSGVVTISTDEMLSYTPGANVVVRPGTKLVQFVEIKSDGTFNVADPKVYAVGTNGQMWHIDSAATAVKFFGATWEQKINAIPVSYYTNYTAQGQMTSTSTYPTGSLLKSGDKYYYVDGSAVREVSAAGITANGLNTDYAWTVASTSGYTNGSAITAKEEAVALPSFGGGAPVPTASGVTVSLGAGSDQIVPVGAASAEIMKINFTAPADGAVTVSQVKLTRGGVGARTDFSYVYIYDGINRIGYGKTISSDNVAIFNNLNFSVPAGSTKALTIRGDISSTITLTGGMHYFTLTAADVTATATVNGSFPVVSKSITIGSATSGTITIIKNGSLSNPSVGDLAAKVAEFKLTSGSSENVKLNRIALYSNGTVANANISNFKLYQGSTLVGSASAVVNNLVTFDLSASPFVIEKNQNRIFSVTADISSSAKPAETIKFYLDQATDLYAVGVTYGFGTTVTNTYDGTSSQFSTVTLQGGQVTVSRVGPESKTLAKNQDAQNWLEFKITAASNIEIKSWRLELHNSLKDSGAPGDLDLNDGRIGTSSTSYLTNVKIAATDGSFATDAKDVLSFSNINGNDNGIYTTFTDVLDMAAGTSKTLRVLVDSETSLGTSGTYWATLGSSVSGSTYTFSSTAVKNTSNNQYITDIVPSTHIAGNPMTYAAAGLTMALGNYKGTQTVVRGTSNVDALKYNFTAASGSDLTVSSIKFTAYVSSSTPLSNTLYFNCDGAGYSGTGTCPAGAVYAQDVINSMKLYKVSGTTYTQLGTAKSIASGYVTFDNLNWKILKGATETIVLRGDTNSNAGNLSHVAFDIDTTSDVTVTDESGNTASVSQETVNGGGSASLAYTSAGLMTKVTTSGSLYVANNASPVASLVAAGTAGATGVPVLKLKFNATDDSFKINKLRITQSQNTTNSRAVSLVKISYKNQAGTVTTSELGLSGSNADFNVSSDPIWVAANGVAEVDVYASFNPVSGTTGSYSGDHVKFTFDEDGAFEAVGTSGTSITETASDDITGNLFTVYKAYPTFTKIALDSSSFTTGSAAIYKFKVTASQGSSIKLKKVALKIGLVGAAAGSSLTLGTITVKEDDTDLSNAASGTDSFQAFNGSSTATTGAGILSDANTISSTTPTDQDVLLVFNDARTVSAGSSKTYTVSASLAGATSAATTYSVNTYLAAADTATAGVSYLTNHSDVSGATGTNSRYGLVSSTNGTSDDAGAYYIWSDVSGTTGNGVNTDVNSAANSAAGASSADWFNGYGFKGLGTTANSIVSKVNP